MKRRSFAISTALSVALGVLATAAAISAQDKNSLKVPGGLSFSEFRGYEGWQVVSMSLNGGRMAVILGNPAMIDAYKAGIPGNGKPIPDGAKLAKIHWVPKTNEAEPGPPQVPNILHDIDFMAKDSKRFADGRGWGYAAFEYDSATDAFRPGTTADHPPQEHDAKCGFACHSIAAQRDYVFTEYPKR